MLDRDVLTMHGSASSKILCKYVLPGTTPPAPFGLQVKPDDPSAQAVAVHIWTASYAHREEGLEPQAVFKSCRLGDGRVELLARGQPARGNSPGPAKSMGGVKK